MKNKSMISTLFLLMCLMWCTTAIIGCAGPAVKTSGEEPPQHQDVTPKFLPVVVKPGETLASLAATYLKNPSMEWLIAEFNEIKSATPGQELIIPLSPYDKGGVGLNGYQTVPVLSYHNFSDGKPSKMSITAAGFEAQMSLLKGKGYHVISLEQFFEFLQFKTQIPKKSVVITIDDGWRSAYEIAFPILKKYGYPATLFVYTDLITGGKKTLSWELLREMSQNGLDIQGHTKTHRNLSLQGDNESFKEYYGQINEEIVESTRIIKEKINKEVKYLAYPYGDSNRLVVALLKKNGYVGAVTVQRGGNPFFIGDFAIKRSMIYGDMDLSRFEKNLVTFSREEFK
jgi:peptidoglycan/xylan/chitin deacetylase (PgdA/CDA1 family)